MKIVHRTLTFIILILTLFFITIAVYMTAFLFIIQHVVLSVGLYLAQKIKATFKSTKKTTL